MGTIEFRRFDASKALENDVNRNCNEHPECKNCPYEGYDSCKLLYLYEKTRDEYYHKGRADKYQEITSEYMLLTEKQVAEIRADTIDELKGKKDEVIRWLIKRDKEGYGTTNGELLDHILEVAEQLKGGRKNE